MTIPTAPTIPPVAPTVVDTVLPVSGTVIDTVSKTVTPRKIAPPAMVPTGMMLLTVSQAVKAIILLTNEDTADRMNGLSKIAGVVKVGRIDNINPLEVVYQLTFRDQDAALAFASNNPMIFDIAVMPIDARHMKAA